MIVNIRSKYIKKTAPFLATLICRSESFFLIL